MKKIEWGKYILIYLAGFLTSFSGVLDSLVKILTLYKEFKKTYIYDSEFLTGNWSTNAEYVINSAELGLLSIQAFDDGSASGEIMSEKICDALPLIWYIKLETESPDFEEFFIDRKFYLKQLQKGRMQTVAVLKLIHEDRKNGAIQFELIGDDTDVLPKRIVLAKNYPQYKSDFKELSNYCAESPKKFWREYYKRQGKKFPESHTKNGVLLPVTS
ncbi:hypothetical protein ARAF_0323 [Arsenophonus endosymbiont of Aleurodicus floccissimus]|uniref:hypothetical protein n=1 Tax=Arsenophonus endosymbiont of Aleurodicus floccissimus TaxID=2152761 RepID=UPI000E6AF127|nr:hypothetical protein [Arsenophonus endosymbiont of Aleurodicus floccissimus]SPP31210.1 hypothetical protein ARAF_0323 [Arsenophonus endosymbiont of Aleurodicus floccissimus]